MPDVHISTNIRYSIILFVFLLYIEKSLAQNMLFFLPFSAVYVVNKLGTGRIYIENRCEKTTKTTTKKDI